MSESLSPAPAMDCVEQVRLTARSRAEVLAQVAREVAAPCKELDAAAIEAALQAREEIRSTNIGDGLAVPHAVLAELETPRVLQVSFDRPVHWGEEGEDVERCVVILVPPGRQSSHLELVAQAIQSHKAAPGD